MKTLYSTKVTAIGGREGRAQSQDGNLNVALALPKQLGGPGGDATNPEQLFGAGYAACFESAIRHVARMKKISITQSSVTADISLLAKPEDGFALGAALTVRLADLPKEVAEALVQEAHQVCPYSNATRGNLDVQLTVVA